MTTWIYPCPDCGADMDDEYETQYCPACGAIFNTTDVLDDDDQRIANVPVSVSHTMDLR